MEKTNKIILICLAALLAIIAVGCGSNDATGAATAGGSDTVTIPLSEISETAQFYQYTDGVVEIRYFVVLGSDGKTRTAFDACDVCGGYKGYKQVGSDIECRNCGRVFSIDGLGTKNKGYGCWPSYLLHTIEGDNVVIKASDIAAGKKRFV